MLEIETTKCIETKNENEKSGEESSESITSDSEHSLQQGSTEIPIKFEEDEKGIEVNAESIETKRAKLKRSKKRKFALKKQDNEFSKRKKCGTDIEFKSHNDGTIYQSDVKRDGISTGVGIEDNLEKKNKLVTIMNVSELETFWLTIEFCTEKDYMQFLNLSTCSRAKEMFVYLLNVCQRRVPFVICSSGWAHVKSLDFISTNIDNLRLSGRLVDIQVRVYTPSQSKLLIISMPMFTVTIKDYIQTSTGKYTTKPTLEDVKAEEIRVLQKI